MPEERRVLGGSESERDVGSGVGGVGRRSLGRCPVPGLGVLIGLTPESARRQRARKSVRRVRVAARAAVRALAVDHGHRTFARRTSDAGAVTMTMGWSTSFTVTTVSGVSLPNPGRAGVRRKVSLAARVRRQADTRAATR